MKDAEQHDFGFADPPNHRMRRGVYLLPGMFTVGNLLCGFYAVLATLKGGITDLDYAARAIGFAIVFDAFDGFIARATKTNTEFGKQFDSLADMVSFGIAPGILAFSWGTQALLQADVPEAKHVSQLAWLVSLAFVICCAWRLARFNVHGMAPRRPEILCRNAHARRGRDDCGHGSCLQVTLGRLALVGGLAGFGPWLGIPDG